MDVMDSTVRNGNVVVLELGLTKLGDPIYRIRWYSNQQWSYAIYRSIKEAWSTYTMIARMI